MDEKTKKIVGYVFYVVAAVLLITGIVFFSLAFTGGPSVSDPFDVFEAKMNLQSNRSLAGILFLAGGGFLLVITSKVFSKHRFTAVVPGTSDVDNAPGTHGVDYSPVFHPLPQTVVVREVIKEIVKVKCPFCGVLVEQSISICPSCGGTVH